MTRFTVLLALLAACGGSLDAGPEGDVDASRRDADQSQVDAAGDADADADESQDGAPRDSDTEEVGTDSGHDADDGPWVRPDRPDVSSPADGASWRYGGGINYPDIVDPDWPIVTVVSSRAELEAALEAAVAGDIVYVDNDATIDLTDATLCIPGGVWLASSRGRDGSSGGLIISEAPVKVPILTPCGDDVRITGLRIYGHDEGQCPPEHPDECTGEDRTGGVNCRDCTPSTIGIQSRGFDRLEVDNCELAGWSYAAVWLSDSVDNLVHHNHIHHTQRQGLGYGVVLTRGGDGLVTVLVEWNRFNYNRHAIAGSGEPGQDYEARNNLVLESSIGHIFDMHGENENTDNGSELSGGEMLIHDNTVLVANQYTMVIRGRPDHGAWLYDNCLARTSAETAALQRFFYGNFYVDESPAGAASNSYGQSASDCERVRFCTAANGNGPWRYLSASSYGLSALRFGDFDGDGTTDVFRADGSEWHWLTGGTGGWEHLNTSSVTADGLGFGDFDGDGRTDVFRANGSEWRVSDGGSSAWRTLRSATDSLTAIAFGDFDGDGATDVFRATGSEWQWSRSGTEAWNSLNTSSAGLGSLGFADFDGDGETDVFHATGSEWQWSRSGTASWERLNGSSYGLSSLSFADVDGDGEADVLRSGSDDWFVSWSGTSGWQRLRIISATMSDVAWGDFNGDGASDAFMTGCL